MPNYTFCCATHNEFDVRLSFKDNIPKTISCPTCGKDSPYILKAPMGIIVRRDWNEQANEAQRSPYTQAKAQAYNLYHEQRDAGIDVALPTEEGIQIAASQIAKTEKV